MFCTDKDDIFRKAITEARKWLKEKKVVLSPLSDGIDVSCGLESVAIQQVSYSQTINFWS